MLGLEGRQQRATEMAKVSAIKDDTVVGTQHRLDGFVNKKGMHRGFGASQILRPYQLRSARSAQFIQPRKVFPCETGGFLRHLIQNAGDIADHAHGYSPIATDLQNRRIDLYDLSIGCHVGWTAKTDGKVLLASQQQNNVGVANLGGGSIQAALEKSEHVWVIIRYQTARLLLRQHRQTGGFDEAPKGIAGKSITGSTSSNNKRFLCLAQERNRSSHTFRMGKDCLFRAVFIWLVPHDLLFVYASFL